MTATDVKPPVGVGVRLHGLDALRAGALGLGIVLHSLMPFAPGMGWLLTDARTSAAVGVPLFVIHLFRMTVFMLLAGFFGRMVVHRRGAGAYLRDRTVRILAPMVAFWPVAVMPLGLLVAANASLRGATPPQPPSRPGAPEALAMFSPGQLWFLLVLFEVSALTLGVRWVALRAARWASGAASDGEGAAGMSGPGRDLTCLTRAVGRALSGPAGVLAAAVPYYLCVLAQGDATGGIAAPTTILPEVAPLVAYLGAFGVGWALHADPDALARIARQWPGQLAAAIALSAAGYVTAPATLSVPGHAALVALAGWTWTYALLGLCVRFLRRERPVIRYLADSSYWAYLVHLPLLVGFELLIADQPWPIAAKLLLTWTVVGAALLGSYQVLVRKTWLGQWLNGHRYGRARR
ncbi:acyltransferase family protein [Nigerium sp.]|uniref:acyltransferase family protein n=1 Tax=Nigerium sp. TaxID=2042655 RepID=UPI0032220652